MKGVLYINDHLDIILKPDEIKLIGLMKKHVFERFYFGMYYKYLYQKMI